MVTQSTDTLTSTQGTWSGDPTTYGYQWKLDGAVVGTDAASRTRWTTADAGKTASCVVTATGAGGSGQATAADVTVTDPAGG